MRKNKRAIQLSQEERLVKEAKITSDVERRLQVRSYEAWVEAAEGRPFPSPLGVAASGLAAFRDNSFLIDLTDGPLAPKLSSIGDALLFDCGEVVPDSPDRVPSLSVLSRLTDHYLQVVANRAPVGFEADFKNRLKQKIRYRGIMLPLSSNGEVVDFVMGVINWQSDTVAKNAAASPLVLTQADASNPDATGGAGEPGAGRVEEVIQLRPRGFMMSVEAKLNECMEIEGAVAVALVDQSSGMAIATAGNPRNLDLNVAAAGNTNVVRAKMATMKDLGLKDDIEDILITLSSAYHMIRPLTSASGKGLFVYMALDKSKANLAMARFKLSKIEPDLTV